jgi:hypothetical protein
VTEKKTEHRKVGSIPKTIKLDKTEKTGKRHGK